MLSKPFSFRCMEQCKQQGNCNLIGKQGYRETTDASKLLNSNYVYMHKYEKIQKLSRSGHVNNIFGSIIPNIAHIGFFRIRRWTCRYARLNLRLNQGFSSQFATSCSVYSQRRLLSRMHRTQNKPDIRLPGSSRDTCLKAKSPHFCSEEKKVFGMCTNITPPTFSRRCLQE